jgi:hypothetical protein
LAAAGACELIAACCGLEVVPLADPGASPVAGGTTADDAAEGAGDAELDEADGAEGAEPDAQVTVVQAASPRTAALNAAATAILIARI